MDSRCGAFLCRTVLKQVPRWGETTLTFFDSKSCHLCCLIQNKLNLKRMSKNVKTVPFHSLRSLATDINDREHRPPILEGQLNGPGGPRPGVEDVPSGRNVLVIADALGVVQEVSGKVLFIPIGIGCSPWIRTTWDDPRIVYPPMVFTGWDTFHSPMHQLYLKCQYPKRPPIQVVSRPNND